MIEHATARRLSEWAAARGWLVAWGPPAAIDVVRTELAARMGGGELDARFARESLSSFSFDLPPLARGRWSVLIVALPRPAHRVAFTVGRRRVEAILPPTYVRYRPTFETVREHLVAEPLAASRVERLDVPLKPLAARLGLVRYGRNNLTYAPPLGTYMQLAGYVTDADLPVSDGWRPLEPALLDDCEDCLICEAVCPTSAIGDDRVLLHAERCLTFANENHAPLPAWIPPGAHHTLIGCLECQRHCPANPDLLVEDTGILFSESETAALLAGDAGEAAALARVREKMAPLALTEEGLIGRNLQALLSASDSGAQR